MEFLEQVNKVSGLLQRIWRTQTSAILPSLKELFTIISSTGNNKKKSEGANVDIGFDEEQKTLISLAWL